jgi:hypothetical protein
VAEHENDDALRAAWMTFVVIGAGPTGRSASSGAHRLSGRSLRQQIFARQTLDLDAAQHEIRREASPRAV